MRMASNTVRRAAGERWGHIAALAGELAQGEAAYVVPVDLDASGAGGVQAVEAFEQGGLAHAVGAKDGHDLAGAHVEVHASQHLGPRVTEMEAASGKQGAYGSVRGVRVCAVVVFGVHSQPPLPRARTMSQRKTGAPMKAVSTLTGSTCGASMRRATVSLTRSSSAPPARHTGRR